MFNLILTVLVAGLFLAGGIVLIYLAYRYVTDKEPDGFKALTVLFIGSVCAIIGLMLPTIYFLGTILLRLAGK